ncbi:uncharacterized protein BCR38DRAFT_185531 [Pseudomassariella vexata]|uniref:Uncharacterized protein n=1 Tax=Pseudomassariella vexata TaxID=1141098 RepID=A0A1Y2DZY9_9PEZI|nr:uncharacterized protein BCR38DRAFT_185531 [Pseudomassariella vexata]ORY64848.1 hypothetical protein BCR38DRAFT_185531 [Pseudomassariella vexata]
MATCSCLREKKVGCIFRPKYDNRQSYLAAAMSGTASNPRSMGFETRLNLLDLPRGLRDEIYFLAIFEPPRLESRHAASCRFVNLQPNSSEIPYLNITNSVPCTCGRRKALGLLLAPQTPARVLEHDWAHLSVRPLESCMKLLGPFPFGLG